MSSSVSPASATAARQASTVSDSGSTISRRPMAERPTPDSTDAVLEAVVARAAAAASGRSRLARRGRSASVAPVGSNSGSHTSSCCSKRTATSWPMCTSSGSQPTMLVVRRTRRVLGQRDVGDRRTAARSPGSHGCWLTVKPTTVARPDTSVGAHDAAAARRADRHRRVDERARSRRSPGCAGGRRPPRSRTTRWPASAGGAGARRAAQNLLARNSTAPVRRRERAVMPERSSRRR